MVIQPFSRRLFLNLAAGSATSLLLRSPPIRISAACQFRQRDLTSPALGRFAEFVLPGKDAFVCERYAADLGLIFDRLGAGLCGSARDLSALVPHLSPAIDFTPLDAPAITRVRRGPPITIDRAQFSGSTEAGPARFLKSLSSYLQPFTLIETAEYLLTGLRIAEESPVVAEVTLRWNLVGLVEGGREERTSEWKFRCKADTSGHWTIHRWLGAQEDRVRVEGSAFVDITNQALHGNDELQRQFAGGLDYWRGVIDGATGIDVYGNNGLAAGDFDGDGYDDLYICQPSGLPNRLLRNRGDGTFEDVTAGSGLGLLDGTASALFADFTNSGTQDLIVVRTTGPLLYLNRGAGKFELQPDAFRFAKVPSGTFTGLAAADYNRDGLLDVYFCLYAYYQGLSQYTHPKPYYDAQNGPPNFLMRNRGDGTFDDATAASGMNVNNNRFTFACGWCDTTGNGWPDLYVANDFGRKNFYRNNGDGTFRDLAGESGVEDFGAGMSVSWSDFDNDGRQDLYVTDMFSAAGARVTQQEAFLPGVDEAIRKAYRKHASGNSLFANVGGNQLFRDDSASSAAAMGRWSWSGDAWDFDHNGVTDLYVTNGFISGENKDNLASFFWRQIVARSMENGGGALDYQQAWNAINELIRADYSWNGYERNVFFVNGGDRRFSEASGALGLDFRDDSRAFALADIDGDGRLEVVLKNRTSPQLRVLKNMLNPIGQSIAFRLRGTKSNRDGIGAVVSLSCGSMKQAKFVRAGSGFLSQHTKDLHFGLGSPAAPVNISIRWPSGAVQTFDGLPAQHLVLVEEGNPKFVAKPFRPGEKAEPQASKPSSPAESFQGSWLLEPLPAPEFRLPDASGRQRMLTDFRGKPLLLVLGGASCPESQDQLKALSAVSTKFQNSGIHLAAVVLDDGKGSAPDTVSFPLMKADAQTAGTYNILYRYMFDRRRPIETPLHLLLNAEGAIVKVQRGKADPQALLADLRNIPATPHARLAKALPFAGAYHGEMPHRNFFTYGVAYVQNEFPDAALQCFQYSLARDPNYAAAHYNIGTIYLNKQMLPEAKLSLERAVALDPQDADALTNLGAISGQQKDYDAAYRYFERAVQLQPAHLVALQNLVMLDRWKGQLDKAQKNLERAVAVDPNDAEFQFALGMLLANQDKFEQARGYLERAVQLRPNDPVTLNNLGVLFLRLNRPNDALQRFNRCVELAPDYDRPFLNIASIYQGAGRVSDARTLLQTFLSRHPENKEIAEALRTLAP